MRCAQEMVATQYPAGTWATICAAAGCDESLVIVPQGTFEDALAVRMMVAAMEVLELSPAAFYEAFGSHFAHTYARRLYPDVYAQSGDFISFIGAVNDIHHRATSDNDGRPPFFELVWRRPSLLTVSYRSDRCLIGLARGLILGYADYYGEEVVVDQVSATRLDVHFAEPRETGAFIANGGCGP